MYNKNKHNRNKGNNSGSSKKIIPLRAHAYQSSNSNFRRLSHSEFNNSSSKSNDAPGSVPMLQYKPNADSNLDKWIEAIQPLLASLFGHLASFITTDKYYKPVAPKAPEVPWTQVNDPGEINRTIEKAKASEYAKEIARLEADKPKMWGEIEKHMSPESKAQVKLNASYDELKAKHNVLKLWQLIKQVHRTQAGKINSQDASLDALTNYYTIKQKENETLIQYKDRLVAAVERIRSADPDKLPNDEDQARKFTKSLDPRRFHRLMNDCEEDPTKYEMSVAGALQQASNHKVLNTRTNELVISDQMITTGSGSHIAGAAMGEQGGEQFHLSRKEKKLIMSFRNSKQQSNQPDGDDDVNPGGRKRGRQQENYANFAGGGKRSRYNNDKPYDRNNNRYNNNKNNRDDKEKQCVICKMNNHWTHECRNLPAAQEAVAQSKSRYRDNQSNQANFGNQQQRPILSENPLHQALTNLRPHHRVVFN